MPRPTHTIADVPPIMVLPLDLPPLWDEHVNEPGFYLAVAQMTSGANWKPVQVWWRDEYRDYELLTVVGQPATIGFIPEAEAFATGVDDSTYELVSSVDVHVPGPNALASVTQAQADAGQNWAAIGSADGWEIIKFQDVTATAEDDVFTISKIHRGQRGTDELISDGAKGLLVMLDRATIHFVRLNRGHIGKEFRFKAAMDGADIANAPEIRATLDGNSLKPFRPRNLGGTRNASNDLTISWVPQSRYRLKPLASGLDDDLANISGFTIEILDAPGGNILRTIEAAAGDRSATYTAAQQTTDGLTPGNPVDVRVVAKSSLFVRGKPVEGQI